MKDRIYLGIELGSTRIKAVGIDENYNIVIQDSYTWKSSYENGIWTYDLNEALDGVRKVVSTFKEKNIVKVGVSAMMHGYLAFDKEWKLLTPFRTWQNTITEQASNELSDLFQFNVPQRWSIAHLYQSIINGEEHIDRIAHITTLAGYIHFLLTGVNAVGIGDASGMFPVDISSKNYNSKMMNQFDELAHSKGFHQNLSDLLPNLLVAGDSAGYLTKGGEELLNGVIKAGVEFAPAEGDASTGMVATNSVRERTGNVSAGTSIFAMVVLEKNLSKFYPEIDVVTTPNGHNVAMIHCNNCTNDMNQWVMMLKETLTLFGCKVETNELYTKLYNTSLDGEADCSEIINFNYLSGEGVVHLNKGVPFVAHSANSNFNLSNFIRSQIYSTMATLKIGMELLNKEGVQIDKLMGHGGLFKTPVVGQKYLAGACNTAVTCMKMAGESGPYGMAILASYLEHKELPLEDYLNEWVFKNVEYSTIVPDEQTVQGFENYIQQYKKLLEVEKKASELLD